MGFLDKIFGSYNDRELKKLKPIVDAIEALEPQTAALSDEELRAMRDVLDLQRFYVEKNGENSSDQIKNQDSEFHRLFYRSSGSKSYYNTLFALHKRMTKFRKASVSKQSRAMQSHQEHEAIFAALEAHDPDAAEKAALAHVQNARARMQSMMEG